MLRVATDFVPFLSLIEAYLSPGHELLVLDAGVLFASAGWIVTRPSDRLRTMARLILVSFITVSFSYL